MEEDNFQLRSLLIQISNQLSDANREELHFIVGGIAPRKLRDDSTCTGTLHLFEYLFDRILLSNEQFDYLIDVFRQIGISDAVYRLQEFKQFQKVRTLSTTSTVSTTLNESIVSYEVDKIADVPSPTSSTFSHSASSCLLSKTTISHEKKVDPSSSLTSKKHKAQVNPLIILIVIINIFSIILFSTLLALKCSTSHHLLPTQIISKDLVYIVKEGFLHGVENKSNQSRSFDDIKDLALSYMDRCTGVELYWMNKYLVSIRFFYSNGRSSSVYRPANDNQLDHSPHSFNNFTLNANEEISKVIFYERIQRTYMNGSINDFQMQNIIVGIQFRTTKGRRSDLFGSDDGRFVVESFAGYVFRSAKGQQQQQHGKRIEMLQLVWFKSTLTNEKTDEPFLYVLDTCSFNYTSEMGNKSRYATGVETSWYDLKREFQRKGENCRPTASYYRTISVEGPFLFAIVYGEYVFYHDAGKWTQYESANNVNCGIINSSSLHPPRLLATTH